MKIVTFVIVGLFVIVAILYWVGGRFVRPYKIGQLRSPIDDLFVKGLDGAYVILSEPTSRISIRIRKYIREESSGLVIIIPYDPSIVNYIEKLEAYFNDRNINFTLDADDLGIHLECLYVDCKDDIDFATHITGNVLVNVFEISSDADIRVKVTGVAP